MKVIRTKIISKQNSDNLDRLLYNLRSENLLLGALLKRIKEQNTLTEFDLMICDWLFMCCNDFSCHFDDLESLICSINNEKDFEKN